MPLETSLPLYGRKEYMARQDRNYRDQRARKQDQITDQQMAMNREKFEFDKQQAKSKGLDLDALAETALLRKIQGVGTPEDDKILQAYSMKEGGKTSYKPDESGRVVAVTEPSLWDRVKDLGSQPYVPPMPRGFDNSKGQGSNPAIETPYDEIQPRMMSQDDVEAQMGNVGQGGVVEGAPGVSLDNKSDFSQMYGSGVTPTDYMRSGPKAQQKKIESDIDVEGAIRQKRAEADLEKEQGTVQAEKALSDYAAQAVNIDNQINKAIDQVSNWTAGAGSVLSNIPGTAAADLEATLSTVQADAAFSRLQAMRDASKTGGALGQVSERELSLLQNAMVALSQSQSPEQLKQNLENYKTVRKNAFQNVQSAFEKDYGYKPKLPEFEQQSGLEGKKVRDKKTGKIGRISNGEFIAD